MANISPDMTAAIMARRAAAKGQADAILKADARNQAKPVWHTIDLENSDETILDLCAQLVAAQATVKAAKAAIAQCLDEDGYVDVPDGSSIVIGLGFDDRTPAYAVVAKRQSKAQATAVTLRRK